eukprot:c1481_g1_i1 orf=1-435(-)
MTGTVPDRMHLKASDENSANFQIPDDIDWHMLDKSKFFVLGVALFSGISATFYPVVVLKTRQQVLASSMPSFQLGLKILHSEGVRGFYRGFRISLFGTVPARVLYMSSLEITKSNVGLAARQMGFAEPVATAVANAAAGLSASVV